MEIVHLGHSSFKISGKSINIVCDPFDPEWTGISFPKVDADVVTISHEQHGDHNFKAGVKGDFICFDSPGEYEIKDAQITGIPSYHDDKNGAEKGSNTIFVYEVDGVNICHLGDLGAQLSSDQLEKMDGVDILMIPVGGTYTIDAKGATKVISDVGPKIVIPMHYRVGKLKELAPLEDFLKEIGKDPKTQDKLKVTKKDLPEEMEVSVLK